MNPRWLEEPSAPSGLPHLPLVRVKPGAGTSGMITSTKLLGVPTHYMSRRTLPCVEKDCPGCEAKLPTRPEWYLALWTTVPSRHIIAALTPAVAWQIKDYFRDCPTLRGCLVRLTRAGKAANSRLLVDCQLVETAQQKLPPEPDLVAHLLHIWGLDQAQLGQDNSAYVNRVREHYRGNGALADAHQTGEH